MKKKIDRKIELFVAPIISIKNSTRVAFRSQVRINDPKMGVLFPEVFNPIADKTSQCKQIFSWTIEHVIILMTRLFEREINFDFISIYAPHKLFEDEKLINQFISEIEIKQIPLEKLALEAYPDYFLEKDSVAFKNAEFLRQKGIKIILLDYASENFPISKISFMPVDIVCIDQFLINCLGGISSEQEYAQSVINIAKNIGKQVIYFNTENKQDLEIINDFVDLGCGKYFGNYVKQRFIKERWFEKT